MPDESAVASNAGSPSSEKSFPGVSSTVSEGAIKLVFLSETEAALGGESIGLCGVLGKRLRSRRFFRFVSVGLANFDFAAVFVRLRFPELGFVAIIDL